MSRVKRKKMILDEHIERSAWQRSKNNQLAIENIEDGLMEIYGAYWNGGSSPTMTRTHGAIGATVNAGTDANMVLNTADFWSVFKDNEEVTDSYGNQFIKWNKCYIRKIFLLPGYYWKGASRFKHDENWYLPACFYDFTNSKELDYCYIGKYPASLSDDGLRLESKSGKFPLSNKNIVQFRDYAKANGAGYQQLDIHVVDLLTTLYEIEFATLNSQSVCAGFTAGQWNSAHTAVIAETGVNRIVIANAYADAYRVGQTIGIGTSLGGNQIASNRLITAISVYDASNKAITFDGAAVNVSIGNIVYNLPMKNGTCDAVASSVGSPVSNSDGKQTFKWHGLESIFGNIWQWVDGININEFQAWVCRNADNYASNLFGAPYEQLGYVNANANGYTIEMGYDANLPFANFPKTLGGSSTTYYSDYYYQNTGQRVARLGGYLDNGSGTGLRAWFLHSSSALAHVSIGGRLVKKQTENEVIS